MSDWQVVETFYGKYHKFEVLKKTGGIILPTEFYVHKDGKPYRGSYRSLRDAVEVAKKESGDKN